jgi:diguanylate cyclase (GGDEF)-like protein
MKMSSIFRQFKLKVFSMAKALRRQYVCIFPSALSLALQQRRIAVIRSRLRFLMTLMAIGLPLWSVLELYIFPHELWLSLLEARILAGLSLGVFVLFGDKLLHKGIGKLWHIYLQLAIVFVVPTLFYVFCVRLPGSMFADTPFALAIANTYWLMPLVIMSFLGFFPLTIIESATIITPFLTAYYMTTPAPNASLWSSDIGMMWVIALLAVTSIVICVSQLHMLVQLVSYSSYDLLTNCLERRSGEEVVKILWHYSIRKNTNLAIAFVDLDHFKQVNDRFGHQAGDKVLAHTAERMKKLLRRSDSIIRWGGEEFLVILPDANLENASKTMQRLAEKGFGALPDGTPQTVSIGVSERLSEAANDEKHLIKIADDRLYQAKESGRSRIMGSHMVVVKAD